MIEPRVYRAAFVPALLAIVLAMFSFESRPRALPQGLAADVLFDGAQAADLATRIATDAPDRRAGVWAGGGQRALGRTHLPVRRAHSTFATISPTVGRTGGLCGRQWTKRRVRLYL